MRKAGMMWILLSWCLSLFAQDPSIRIIEQDCTSGSEFVLIQARIYNSGGKQIRADYRYSTISEREFAPLILSPDPDDDSLFWAFIPEAPQRVGVSTGLVEYTIVVESAFGEVFSESAVIEIAPTCAFNPNYNPGQAAELANLKNLLTKEEQIRLQGLQLQRAKRSRNYWVGASLLVGGAAYALADSGDDETFLDVTVSVQTESTGDLQFQFGNQASLSQTENIQIVQAVTDQTFRANACILPVQIFDAQTPRSSRTLTGRIGITTSDSNFSVEVESISTSNLARELTLTHTPGSETFTVQVDQSVVLDLIQDYARAADSGQEPTFRPSFVCDGDVSPFVLLINLSITRNQQ